MRRRPWSIRRRPGRPLQPAGGRGCSSCNWRYRQTRRERRAGRPTRSRLGAAAAEKLVVQLAFDELLHGLGGELLARPRQVVLGKLVQVAGELGGDEHAEILVASLLGDFGWGDDSHGWSCWMLVTVASHGSI